MPSSSSLCGSFFNQQQHRFPWFGRIPLCCPVDPNPPLHQLSTLKTEGVGATNEDGELPPGGGVGDGIGGIDVAEEVVGDAVAYALVKDDGKKEWRV